MTVRRLGSLAVILLISGLVFGQGPAKKDPKGAKAPPKPAPGSLEDTLEKALRNSADIKAAEAKVRDAEAELNRVRQQVLTKATVLYSDLNLAKRMLAVAEASLKEAHREVQTGRSTEHGILVAQAMVEKHRGELEKIEAELKSLRGEFAIKGILNLAFEPDGRRIAGTTADGTVRIWDTTDGTFLNVMRVADGGTVELRATPVQTPMAERVRKLLDLEVEFKEDKLLVQAVQAILEQAKSDIPFRALHLDNPDTPVQLQGKLPVGAWLQAIEDTDPRVAIVVRDYGLLLTSKDRVPTGAVGVSELWKSKKSEPKPDPKGPGLDKK